MQIPPNPPAPTGVPIKRQVEPVQPVQTQVSPEPKTPPAQERRGQDRRQRASYRVKGYDMRSGRDRRKNRPNGPVVDIDV